MSQNKHPEFLLDEDLIYLNHAAVSPWPKRTSLAVKAFAEENCNFGAKNYPRWLKKEFELRVQLHQLLNSPSVNDIALVKNTSEAISFVAYGLDWNSGDNIVSSDEEFPSNRIPWQSLSNQGVEFRQANLMRADSPEEALFDLVDQNTRLITISSIQFASGARLDLEKIGHFCKTHQILFCIDAIQSLGAIQFDVQAYQADFVMADGHKWMLGPEGLGVFYTTPEARKMLKLTQYGWHMMKDVHDYQNMPWELHPHARRFECGSPNMLGIHALSASLSLLLEIGIGVIEKKVIGNARYLIEMVNQSNNLVLLSRNNSTLLSGIVLFKHRSASNSLLFNHLKSNNIICAQRGNGIRFSAHFYNNKDELARAVKIADSY